MKLKLYVLDKNRQAVPATEKEWATSLMSPDRFVGQWVFHDDIFVSTVFLGLDHNWSGHGPPLLYETMVFGGPLDQYQERSSTWQEAEQVHERVCAEVAKRVLQ